jgi:hypothetical protein
MRSTNTPLSLSLISDAVYMNKICLDLFSDFKSYFSSVDSENRPKYPTGWSPAYTVYTILLQLQSNSSPLLLCSPLLLPLLTLVSVSDGPRVRGRNASGGVPDARARRDPAGPLLPLSQVPPQRCPVSLAAAAGPGTRS